jgi:methylamine---glutamate N-methyltransferase subunit C
VSLELHDPGESRDHVPPRRFVPHHHAVWNPHVIEDIQLKAELGRYRYRGMSTTRPVPNFDDLTFLPCTLSRVPLEGYRERCETRTVLGSRFAEKPVELQIPITVCGMSFGALSRNAKAGVGLGATRAGTSTTTGDGGMHPMEREHSEHLVYQICPSHYGNDARDMALADAVEIVVGQGAKPGTGGVLLGAKVSDEVARMRRLPLGVDQRSPVRHPDFIGPADLRLKIEQIREATDWQVPVYVKIGAARVRDDVKLAAKAGADVIVVDGMEGGSAATPDILYDHTGIPTLAAICEARRALEDLSLLGEVQIVLQGGIKNGADVAKALALGADAVGVGSAILIALGCNSANYVEDYHALGVEPGHCAHCHTGLCPVGITTQDETLIPRLPVEVAAERVENFLNALTLETQMFARACGKQDVHDLEPEDLRTLTLEASMITEIPLVGCDVPFGLGTHLDMSGRIHDDRPAHH